MRTLKWIIAVILLLLGFFSFYFTRRLYLLSEPQALRGQPGTGVGLWEFKIRSENIRDDGRVADRRCRVHAAGTHSAVYDAPPQKA
ncbi:hypothetical protein [Paenibacillus sp. FJAT-26967]|uniref:hypothetical protein n=1 Tax=Paenibacillus sp. FJAT-26967 TaxID=1729690 RepID=UPI000AAB63BF|nr:hypothetical protein [Paenibacillus sp. FJAT-26967]